MKFSKMHGIGNNYVYVETKDLGSYEQDLASLAIAVANVNTGIGSDGLITIGPSDCADVRMRIFNADGSEGENCGNGLRCVGKYVYDKRILKKDRLDVETKAGIMHLELHIVRETDIVDEVTVDMGEPKLSRAQVPVISGDADGIALHDAIDVLGTSMTFTAVSMGNPHAVFFVDNVLDLDVAQIGPVIERHSVFPQRVNAEFVTQLSAFELDFRVWERGSGITQACGTGACASVVASVLTNRVKRGDDILVHLLGGDLRIRYDEDGHVYMRGPAAIICQGEWLVP